ncbi:MAG TPA: substrate-binding domain-containing protein [Anaerolineae bacterium]
MLETRKRRFSILTTLREAGELTVDELAVQLGVSANTIRNDLDALAASEQLQRVRGGARALSSKSNDLSELLSRSFLRRRAIHKEAKQRIAGRAADLIVDGASIILDASSTCFYLANQLGDRHNLTVVTSGVEVAHVLARDPSNTVIVLGGVMRPDGMLVSTLVSEQFLKDLHIRLAFVSGAGFTPEAGLTETNLQEAQLKRQMIAAAGSVIALIDASKFGKVDLAPFATTAQVAHIFTDSALDQSWIDRVCNLGGPTVLTVCNDRTTSTYSPRHKDQRSYRIGFANLTERMPFAQQVRLGLERVAALQDNTELLIRDNDLDPQQAVANVDWFIEHGVDLVIEYQIDAAAGNVIMDRFRQSGIPVIAVDIPLPGAVFFGADNYRAGYLAGEGLGGWIREHWNGKLDHLLCLQDTRAGATPAARIQGGRDGLESLLGPIADECVLPVETSSLMDETRTIVRELLPSLPASGRIAVIAYNDDAAVGALAAFEEAGWLDRIAVVGQNADRLGRAALQRAELPFVGTTDYAAESYGEQLLDLALKMLRGEPSPPAVYVEHAFVTASQERR